MTDNEKYLNQFREVYQKLYPKIEKNFGVSLGGVKFRPMTSVARDVSRVLLEKDWEELKGTPALGLVQAILEFSFSPRKISSSAMVLEKLPKNVYVSTYPHTKLRSKKSIGYVTAHELCHSSTFLLHPQLLTEPLTERKDLKGLREFNIRYKTLEAVAEYLVPEVLDGIGYSPIVRVMRFCQNFKPEHRFVKKVCEKKGKEFIMRVLENPPKNRKEMKNPELYLQRVD